MLILSEDVGIFSIISYSADTTLKLRGYSQAILVCCYWTSFFQLRFKLNRLKLRPSLNFVHILCRCRWCSRHVGCSTCSAPKGVPTKATNRSSGQQLSTFLIG